MKFQNDEISSTTLSRIPRRHNNRNTVVLKFGGTTLGSSKSDQRIKLARQTIMQLIEQGRHVVPVFSALRLGRSGSSEKFSVTDYLQNYRRLIRGADDPDLAVTQYREKLQSVHQRVLEDLGIQGYGSIEQVIEREISWVCRTISATALAFENVPSLNDSIVTAGERMAIAIIAAYLNHCHDDGRFPLHAKAVSALELGLYTDNNFGAAQIDWQRAIEHTRETVFAQFLDQGVIPIVSGFDGIYQQPCGFDEMVQSRTEKSGTSIPSNVYRTSLGRGGSDLTATFLGLALDAEYVGFCKETCGVLTGDDLMVGPSAETVSRLTYDLATEAGNIYSKAVAPVRAAKIPIRIFDPAKPDPQTIVSDVELPDGFYIMDRPQEVDEYQCRQYSRRTWCFD